MPRHWAEYEAYAVCSCGRRFDEAESGELWKCAKSHAKQRADWDVQHLYDLKRACGGKAKLPRLDPWNKPVEDN